MNKSVMPKTRSLVSILAVLCVTFLATLISGSLVLSPSDSSAESRDADVSVLIDSTIAITTDATAGTLSIPLTPTASGTQAEGILNVDVATNNPTGYKLTMNTATNTPSLTHSTLSATIPSTTNPIATPSALSTNTWGYNNWTDSQISSNTSPTTFYRIPGTTADTLRATSAPAASSISRLSFAAKADTTIPSGTYSHTVTFSATSNEVPILDLGAMQTMTYCPYTRAKAYDARDNQYYYVQKIPNSGANGEDLCWMESNLRYAGGGTNTYGDTKTLTEWTTSGQYPGGSSANAYLAPYYVDPNTMGSSTTTQGSTDYTDTTPSGGFYGYLYNWCAAMGGQANANACNNTSTTGFDTTTSICPAGWRLPTGGTTGEFQAMTTAINATNDTAGSTNLRNQFLAVFSGLYGSSLGNQGANGYWWSSTVNSATSAYNLNFNASNVYPATNGNRNASFAVRCVR